MPGRDSVALCSLRILRPRSSRGEGAEPPRHVIDSVAANAANSTNSDWPNTFELKRDCGVDALLELNVDRRRLLFEVKFKLTPSAREVERLAQRGGTLVETPAKRISLFFPARRFNLALTLYLPLSENAERFEFSARWTRWRGARSSPLGAPRLCPGRANGAQYGWWATPGVGGASLVR